MEALYLKARAICTHIYANISGNWDETSKAHLIAAFIRTLDINTDMDNKTISFLIELKTYSPELVSTLIMEERIIINPESSLQLAKQYSLSNNISMESAITEYLGIEIIDPIHNEGHSKAYFDFLTQENMNVFQSFSDLSSGVESFRELLKVVNASTEFMPCEEKIVFLKQLVSDRNILYNINKGDIVIDFFGHLNITECQRNELTSGLKLIKKRNTTILVEEAASSSDSDSSQLHDNSNQDNTKTSERLKEEPKRPRIHHQDGNHYHEDDDEDEEDDDEDDEDKDDEDDEEDDDEDEVDEDEDDEDDDSEAQNEDDDESYSSESM